MMCWNSLVLPAICCCGAMEHSSSPPVLPQLHKMIQRSAAQIGPATFTFRAIIELLASRTTTLFSPGPSSRETSNDRSAPRSGLHTRFGVFVHVFVPDSVSDEKQWNKPRDCHCTRRPCVTRSVTLLPGRSTLHAALE